MEEQTVNTNDEYQVRKGKLQELKDESINPYPARLPFERTHTASEAILAQDGTEISVTGRILLERKMGKLIFCRLRDDSGDIQIVLKKDEIGDDRFVFFSKKIDIADIIAVSGERFVTQKGEISILVKEYTLLSKTLRPLPDKFKGLQDEEILLRKRYLDLLVHPELKELFRRKAIFWQSMRNFLIEEGFLEVETPVLENTAGGADAEPFLTHHNALDIDVFLRISMGELWQKRLMVAGFEKTFEIGRQFRNEGMSREHLQDYTQMEFYLAYADYEKGMELVEKLYKQVIQTTWGSLVFHEINGFKNVDFSGEWKRIDYVETILKKTGVHVLKASEAEMRKKLNELKIVYSDGENRARLMDSLWKYCRKGIQGPVFLVHVPIAVSPLAKRLPSDPELSERYQVIIAGSEVGNGYSELNDPIDQAIRFGEQGAMREAGDTEAQMHDADFVEALEHGMPPTTGFGVSERLFSFLENKPIRECVLFPLMRPVDHEKN